MNLATNDPLRNTDDDIAGFLLGSDVSTMNKIIPPVDEETVNIQTFNQWLYEDATSQTRVDWLRSANECTQYADNKIIRETEGDIVAKTSYFPRLINTSVGMLVRASLQPQCISSADNIIQLTEPITSMMQWRWNQLVTIEMKKLWFYDLIIRGMAVWHVEFDDKMRSSISPHGDARITIVNPRYMFFDKWARTAEDVKRLSVVHWVTRRDAEKKWGKGRFNGDPNYTGIDEITNPLIQDPTGSVRNPQWEAIPIIEPLWRDTDTENWLYPSIDDANILTGIGIDCTPGQLMKPPDDYADSQYAANSLFLPKEVATWKGTFYYADDQLEDVSPTFTGNNPYVTTIAFPVENSPQGVGLVHHVRGVQFASSLIDTVNLRLMLDSQSRFTIIDGSKVQEPQQAAELQAMFDNQSPHLSTIVALKADPTGITRLNDLFTTIEPKPITQEFITLSKYMGEMAGVLSGISDWTVGAFPASDSGVKSKLRQQSQIPQLDPMFAGVEGGFERAFNELYAIIKKCYTNEMAFPDRMSYGNTKYIPINKTVQPDQAQAYSQQGHLVADDGNGGLVVNPIALAKNFQMRVRVNTMSNADKYEQVSLNQELAANGYLPPDEVLEPHPVYGNTRKELLDKAQQFKNQMTVQNALLQAGIQTFIATGQMPPFLQNMLGQQIPDGINSQPGMPPVQNQSVPPPTMAGNQGLPPPSAPVSNPTMRSTGASLVPVAGR